MHWFTTSFLQLWRKVQESDARSVKSALSVWRRDKALISLSLFTTENTTFLFDQMPFFCFVFHEKYNKNGYIHFKLPNWFPLPRTHRSVGQIRQFPNRGPGGATRLHDVTACTQPAGVRITVCSVRAAVLWLHVWRGHWCVSAQHGIAQSCHHHDEESTCLSC